MGLSDAFKGLFGGMPNEPPIPPPSYPEYGGMYAAMEQEDLKGVVGVTLDNSSLLIRIEQYLRGQLKVEERDPKTGKVESKWKKFGEPKMNELGIQSVLMEVSSFLDKNTIMGFMPDRERLDTIWERWAIEFTMFLASNKKHFEIVPSYRGMLLWHITLNVLITMQRSLEGNEKQGVYKQLRRVENQTLPMNYQNMTQQKPNGMFRP
jgi:hypothetical protein